MNNRWRHSKDKEGGGYRIIFNGEVIACGLPARTACRLCYEYNILEEMRRNDKNIIRVLKELK